MVKNRSTQVSDPPIADLLPRRTADLRHQHQPTEVQYPYIQSTKSMATDNMSIQTFC